jgi:hypothetical protein
MRDREPFALAGLWEQWKANKDTDPIGTFTVITTSPNEICAPIHDRMPAIIAPAGFDAWLSIAAGSEALLRPRRRVKESRNAGLVAAVSACELIVRWAIFARLRLIRASYGSISLRSKRRQAAFSCAAVGPRQDRPGQHRQTPDIVSWHWIWVLCPLWAPFALSGIAFASLILLRLVRADAGRLPHAF